MRLFVEEYADDEVDRADDEIDEFVSDKLLVNEPKLGNGNVEVVEFRLDD